ncbi:MAG TPA: SDR family oxidoreductase [Stellaceae bacterium]|nr:SDR family oxidoreductase [Stellaceae bacterium]
MQGKTCVITGATSGIGLAAAVALAARGASLALVGRDRARGEAALARVRAAAPGVRATMHYADLLCMSEVRRLGAELLATYPRIDVLVNNAGALFERRELTDDALERTFALNHMAYFLLTHVLRERLAASAPARVVSVASRAHQQAKGLDLDDLNLERGYSGWTAYCRSKLANILFTRALARRLAGTGVTANCLHPGFVASRFGDNNRGPFRWGIGLGKRFFAISEARGAETVVYLASDPVVASTTGGYFANSKPATPTAAAQDDRVAERLWEISAKLAG